MPYLTQSQIESLIPALHLIEALDDDGDGVADEGMLDAIISGASQEVDAALGSLYTVPFADPVPAAVSESALCFALERVYARRLSDDTKNPWKSRANAWRERLNLIGTGKQPLVATQARAVAVGGAIVEDARTMGESFL